MSDEPATVYDAIVVGGGPAGASAAGLLAQEGRSVLVLEREKFPRYHIGESLIPGVWPTLDRLGLREKLDAMGFTKKYGGSLVWGKGRPSWNFSFEDGGPYPYAYQVRRADFDALLLTHARTLGADVVEEAVVKEPLFTGERLDGVRYQLRGADRTLEARARIVVDASGQHRWLGRHFDLVEWHEDLRNIAVWAYYQGCGTLPGREAGNILIEHVPGGWLWFIPLSDGTTSIGYVTRTALLAASGESPEQLFTDRVEGSRGVADLMKSATRVSGHRTTKDWSYHLRRFHGPGWIAVGDAAAFVDPLLSTGVTLALRGGSTAATTVASLLDDPASADAVLKQYEQGYRRFLDGILDFVRAFYDQSKHREDYYDEAQQIFDPTAEMPAHVDFVTLVSGLIAGEFTDDMSAVTDHLAKLRERGATPPPFPGAPR
ncbi:NAD(P)/FAD-dependent oxidoreductase [Streptomyces sp. NPDC002536]